MPTKETAPGPDKQKLSAIIGTAARRARMAKKLTQEDIGDLIGVTGEFYARIERGHALPSVQTFCRMVTALQVDADVLLGLAAREGSDASGPAGSWIARNQSWQSERPEIRRIVRQLRQARPTTWRVVESLLRALEEMKG